MIDLSLTEDEADLLVDLLSLVGGYADSRRRHATEILAALRSEGCEGTDGGDIINGDNGDTAPTLYITL